MYEVIYQIQNQTCKQFVPISHCLDHICSCYSVVCVFFINNGVTAVHSASITCVLLLTME